MAQYSDYAERLKRIFIDADADGNGTLSSEEFMGFLRFLDFPDEEMDVLLATVDSDHSGHINYKEFIDWIYSSETGTKSSLERVLSIGSQAKLEGSHGGLFRAPSVEYLTTTFLAEMLESGFPPEARVYEIEPIVIRNKGAAAACPRDGRLGTSYVDAMRDGADRATHMLSYSWGYRMIDIVSSLQAWCTQANKPSETTFVWICCLCINQHRVQEAMQAGTSIPFEEFEEAFRVRVQGIGKILALMEPWDRPRYLTRAWCIFEFYYALQLPGEGLAIEILMPPHEMKKFQEALTRTDGLQKFWDMIGAVDLAKAEASRDEDRLRILELIQNGSGVSVVNQKVVKQLQVWCSQAAAGQLDICLCDCIDTDTLLACARASEMLVGLGQYAQAEQLVGTAWQKRPTQGAAASFHDAVLLRVRGLAKRGGCDFDDAIFHCQQAEQIHLCNGTLDSHEGALLLHLLGKLFGDRKDLLKERSYHKRALDILEKSGPMKTQECAQVLRSIGMTYLQQRDLDEALLYFNRAKEFHELTNSIDTPDGVAVLKSIGDAYSRRPGNLTDDSKIEALKQAVEAYAEAWDISMRLGLGDTDYSKSLKEAFDTTSSFYNSACLLSRFSERS